jgi:hypothetical protein
LQQRALLVALLQGIVIAVAEVEERLRVSGAAFVVELEQMAGGRAALHAAETQQITAPRAAMPATGWWRGQQEGASRQGPERSAAGVRTSTISRVGVQRASGEDESAIHF